MPSVPMPCPPDGLTGGGSQNRWRNGRNRAARAAARRIAEALRDGSHPAAGLSPREREILPWLATDLGYAAIALELGYSPHNARLLARQVLRKLGVATRAGAVARWLRPDAFPEIPTRSGRIDRRGKPRG